MKTIISIVGTILLFLILTAMFNYPWSFPLSASIIATLNLPGVIKAIISSKFSFKSLLNIIYFAILLAIAFICMLGAYRWYINSNFIAPDMALVGKSIKLA